MVKATIFHEGAWSEVDTYSHLTDAIDGLLDSWNEDEGPFVVILSDDLGVPYASMVRHEFDPEVAIVVFTAGHTTRYRAHYVLDGRGEYVRTDVTVLSFEDEVPPRVEDEVPARRIKPAPAPFDLGPDFEVEALRELTEHAKKEAVETARFDQVLASLSPAELERDAARPGGGDV